ncbi:UNVERIFIED_ORG: hypothetical protein ABIC43_002697 [Variovorax guangxiensis]
MTPTIRDTRRASRLAFQQALAIAASLSLALLCSAATAAAPKAPPKFADYLITARDQPSAGPRPPLRLTTRTARRYTTVIHRAYSEPPNFAGHLRVASWGCGTDCRNFAVLDQNTGQAYTLPNVDAIVGAMGNADERVDFRLDSRLLIISGSFNEKPPEGKFYYLWTGQRLKRIFTGPLAVETIDTSPVETQTPAR